MLKEPKTGKVTRKDRKKAIEPANWKAIIESVELLM